MPREYRHIKLYEKEKFELKEQGLSQRQIAERLVFPYEKMHDFFKRHNRNQRKVSGGEGLKRKGRPRKDETELPPSVQQLSKLTQLQYELAMKERHINRLEMENELMRDFLLFTEVRTSVKYMVIYRHKDRYPISEMCRFFCVSRSGYYDYVKRIGIYPHGICHWQRKYKNVKRSAAIHTDIAVYIYGLKKRNLLQSQNSAKNYAKICGIVSNWKKEISQLWQSHL